MAISTGIPKCPYCGERVSTISDKPFDGAIYPDWKGHNKTCKNHPLNKQTMNTSNKVPRRMRIDLLTPVEKAIYDAMQEVEKLPADIRLTDAVNLLSQAKDKVSDYVDTPCEQMHKMW